MKRQTKEASGVPRDTNHKTAERRRIALEQAKAALAANDKRLGPIERGFTRRLAGFFPAPEQKVPSNLLSGQPSPEWLADMCVRLLLAADTHTATTGEGAHHVVHSILGGTEAEQGVEIGIGLRAAWECYKLSEAFLLTKNVKMRPVPAFIAPEEIDEDYVAYERACVLMTGEPKPKRAMEKWQRYERATCAEAEAAGRELPSFPEPYEWTPRGVMHGMEAYEKFAKKPIDITKSQYAPHPGHAKQSSGQKVARAGQAAVKVGQK
jgi:hypothetical protein